MDLHRFALAELPPPPIRVLEVGCGGGELAVALAADGYDVVAIDPVAPDGPIFRRVTLEELDEPGPFDAAVASLSLHHVDDLDVALDKLHGLLRPGAPVVVREFARDRLDEPTARWYHAQRRDETPFESWWPAWQAEHQHLHASTAMRTALDARFVRRSFAWTPYLYAYDLDPAVEPLERKLIARDEIRATGFTYVGERR